MADNKQFLMVNLTDGNAAPLQDEPMVKRTIRQFQDCDAIKEIVVVTS